MFYLCRYVAKLETEIKEWHGLIENTRRIKHKPFESDINCLNTDQKVFCNAAPNFTAFQEDSIKFCKKSDYYLKMRLNYINLEKDLNASIRSHFLKYDDDIIAEQEGFIGCNRRKKTYIIQTVRETE